MNPLTRQMNKDIIRSHNEVMQVIGVAEPENVVSEPQKLTASHHAWENDVGLRLLRLGRLVNGCGVWGVMGMQQRILVRPARSLRLGDLANRGDTVQLYQPYSHIPLLQLWSYERQQRSLSAMLFAGYPAFATVVAMVYSKTYFPIFSRIYEHPYGRRMYAPMFLRRQLVLLLTRCRFEAFDRWIVLHLTVFSVLQMLDVLPVSTLLPGLMFFIPCSSTSVIPAPPAPTAFTAVEVLKWVGNLGLNAAPLAGVYSCHHLFHIVRSHVREYFRSRLPTPTQSYTAAIRDARTVRESRTLPAASQAGPSATPPQPSAPPAEDTPETQPKLNAGGFPTTSQMRPRDEPRGHPETSQLESLEGTPAPAEGAARGHVRRQSTISTRGLADGFMGADSYGSDDEDNSGDMVSTTLISFDVEATDATDPPPGQWSAELRPNVAEGSRSEGGAVQSRPARRPTYRSTALTRLPSTMAADQLAWLTTGIVAAPVESLAVRWFVSSFARARGLSVAGMYPLWSLGWSRHTVANFVGMLLVQFFIQFDIWASMYAAASFFFFTEEEWSYIDGPESEVD